jgi:S1-C subfamily serine protease/regulator of sirC expression with transglutaminase-like and TPR domain
MARTGRSILVVGMLLSVWSLGAGSPPSDKEPKGAEARTVEQLAETARKSVVVIYYTGREGKQQGLGTGFVVSADGLIATNFHVIGEGRPITVRLADGKRYEVTTVHASDRALDLALIKIDAKGLTPLELGDSDKLKAGQAVVAVGNPHGLENSVVSGVVSGKREIEGRAMIQVAVPIEQGNSGGPLLDMQGRVQGILTMKSLVTANLGFAMPVNALNPLLKKPNPVPMSRWLTIGALDAAEWKALAGARWRQRAGRIIVDGAATTFGGRSLCLWQHPVPKRPFEIAVTVRLDDEAGAAGLVFHADGENKHYGFYPTAGKLRLSRFEGPDVFSWKVLQEVKSPHYRPGEWNTLKVRIKKDRFVCYVNDQQVLESTDMGLTDGKIGLVKFRDTEAEFKQFQVAAKIPPLALPAEIVARVGKAVAKIPPEGAVKPKLVDTLVNDAPASVTVLRDRARLLEKQAAELRKLAAAVHHKQVQTEILKALDGKESAIDLLHAALLVAKLDNEELDVAAYRKEVDRLARELAAGFPKDADAAAKLAALKKYFFSERGFHGSRQEYYTRANSYLNEVIDDREGLPITLSVLYIELARRVGLDVVGVAMPGHFIVKHIPPKGEPELIDVFDGGKALTQKDAARIVKAITGRALKEKDLEAASKQAIIVRMLNNLVGVARAEKDAPGVLRYLDTILTINPELAEERWMRAILRYQMGEKEGSLADVDWLLEHHPPGIDLDDVRELRKLLLRK